VALEVGLMTFEEARPIVEGRLYAWGAVKKADLIPLAGTARYSEYVSENGDTTSAQERYVVKYEQELCDAELVDKTLNRLSSEQQRLIELRYMERRQWPDVADGIHVGLRTVYNIRDMIIAILAYEFGLLEA
jgi:DNA-directed RNA polymerase specialized sigma subunit